MLQSKENKTHFSFDYIVTILPLHFLPRFAWYKRSSSKSVNCPPEKTSFWCPCHILKSQCVAPYRDLQKKTCYIPQVFILSRHARTDRKHNNISRENITWGAHTLLIKIEESPFWIHEQIGNTYQETINTRSTSEHMWWACETGINKYNTSRFHSLVITWKAKLYFTLFNFQKKSMQYYSLKWKKIKLTFPFLK